MLEQDGFKPILRFIACSDTHFTEEVDIPNFVFTDAMEQAYELCDKCEYPNLDAVCIVGDTAVHGRKNEFLNFKQTVDKIFRPETKVKIVYGGHETWANGESAAIEYTKTIYKTEPLTHEVIKGYHFIMISTIVNNARQKYPEYQKEWLREQLEIARKDDPRKPIFVFHHPNLRGTVFGHEDWSNPGLEPIVADFPQIIDFSGHSHYPINAPSSIYQGLFTALNTGSFAGFDGYNYYKLTPFKEVGKYKKASQFYFVEVNAQSQVRIYPYDAVSRSFFPMVWKIDKPYDPSSYLYTDKIRYAKEIYPYFTEGSSLTLERSGEDTLVLKFPQAQIDEEYVKEYRYVVRRADDSIIWSQTSEWSAFHIVPQPEIMISRIPRLEYDVRYIIEVEAVSFWEKCSKTKLTAEFVLRDLPEDKTNLTIYSNR